MLMQQTPWGYPVTDVRAGTLGFTKPNALYFIYMRFDRDSGLYVRHYYDELRHDETVEGAEQRMLKEARPGFTPPSDSRLVGANFENIYWKKKCYFTLFLDEAEWDFYSFPADKEAPIVFVAEKSQVIDGRVVTGPTLDKNVSFFDAEKIKIAGRNAVRCINYKKRDAAGADNETGTTQSLAFEIYLRAPFASGHSANPYITMIIDPPGNNDGPP